MKTKLLKIVRKRYYVLKILEVNNPNAIFYGCDFYPVFAVFDNHSNYRTQKGYNNYDAAFKELIKWIKSDYRNKIRKPDSVTEKVWYNK